MSLLLTCLANNAQMLGVRRCFKVFKFVLCFINKANKSDVFIIVTSANVGLLA